MEWVAHIHDRISVAEHMPDKSVPLMQDNLHAIGPTALIAACQKADVLG
jgi:hypothetical protein